MEDNFDNEVIQLTLGDWTWNASITGFINIIGKENVKFNGCTAEVPIYYLENFEEKYFKYFIDTYEKTLPWYRIVSFKETIEHYRENAFKNFNLQGLKGINAYIGDTAKRYLTSKSITSAFELMGIAERIGELEKRLQRIKEPKDGNVFDKEKTGIVENVKKQFDTLEEIIGYCGSNKGRRFIGAKNVIYSIIKNGWNGVSFLNKQTKIKDVYEDYRTYFVNEAMDYLKADKSKYKYPCFTCGSPIKDFSNDMGFINQSGFDVARKSSHVWNFVNDVALCPVCKLIYSCLPAGFSYVGDTGLYINANMTMENNIKVNSNVRFNVTQAGREHNSRKIYWVLLEAIKKQHLSRQKYELADVQVVRWESESYKFNLLPEATIELVKEFEKEIGELINTWYKEGKDSYGIYEQVLENIFNNRNQFLLIYKLLHYKTAAPKDGFFHMGNVINILKINFRLIQNLGGMEKMGKGFYYINSAKEAGEKLRNAYLEKDPKTGKIPGISYRLLNALKTGNKNMFMDVVINCYLYVGKPIPNIITEALRDEDGVFETIGYAFVSGLNGTRQDVDNKKDNKEENENG